MKIQDYIKCVATPARIFVTCLIILIAVTTLQTITREISGVLALPRVRSTATEPQEQLSEAEIRAKTIQRAAKEFLPDGSIHLVTRVSHAPTGSTKSGTDKIFDTNDNLLWEGPHDERPYEYLSWTRQLRVYSEGCAAGQMRQSQMITPEFSRTLEIPVGSSQKVRQIWMYSPDSDLFTGYALSGGKIGYAGSTGFTDSKSEAKRLGEFRFFTAWSPLDSYAPTLLWQTRRRIFQINFEKQHVELVFESAEADIESMNLNAWRGLKPGDRYYVDSERYRPLLHCATDDGKHHLIMRNPDRHLTVAIPEDWQGWVNSNYRFTAMKQDVFLRRDWTEFPASPDYLQDRENANKWWRDYRSQPKKHHVELYRVDNKGGLDLLNRYSWIAPAQSGIATLRDRPALERCVNQFSPPLYGAVPRLLPRSLWSRVYSRQGRGNIFYDLARAIPEFSPVGWVINWVLSAAMMGFAFWHGWPRRTSRARFVFWLVFVAAFNLAGLLTYLALNHSAVITCPACGRRRGLARIDCAQCQSQLPTPEPGKLDLIFET